MKNSLSLAAMLTALAMVFSAWSVNADEPLGSSEQFRIDQVHRSLDNVDKDLQRIETADREGAAELALKGAHRNLDQARERLQQFLSRHADLSSHPDVASTQARLQQLAARVDAAGSSGPPIAAAASTAEQSAGQASGAGEPESTRSAPAAAQPSTASPSTPAELSRKQAFELQQIETTVNNAVQSLDDFREAERDDVAALALKGARRGRDEAGERLDAFIDANPDAGEAPPIAAVRTRIEELTAAIARAESDAEAEAAVATSAGADATADAEQILALRSEHADAMDVIHGRSVVYSDSADGVSEALAVIEKAEQAGDAMRPFLLEFRQRYGADENEIQRALDAEGADAASSNSRVAYNAGELFGFLEELGRTRTISAQTVAEHVAGRLADIDDYSAKVQQQRLAEADEMVRLGQAIDPNNPRLNRLRGEVAQLSQAKQAEQMARVESAEWPDHVSNFEGPGRVDDLAGSVRDYLADDRDWGNSEKRPQDVLAVTVTGPWQVAAQDLFGRPIQWRLPVMVAITDAELEPGGIAQAFEVSMVAKQGAPNQAPKSPPWDGFWVGDNYFLKIDALP